MKKKNYDFTDDKFQKDVEKYIACMEEIKLRQKAIAEIMLKNYTTPFEMTNVEFICLQFRKILELIALGSLSANKEQYEKAYKKFYNHWKAKQILNDIGKINHNFYPVPTKQIVVDGTPVETVPISHGYLTKDDFVKIYNDCSEMLHSKNPYNKKLTDLEVLKGKFSEWNSKITTLLNHHQLQLYKSDFQLWVMMNANSDNRVHATIMMKISKD